MPEKSTEILLEVKNLKKYFLIKENLFRKHKICAVDDISFVLYRGETLGVVGESGCGKSTLGRAILRLIEIDAGEIIFNNIEIHKLKKKQLQPLRKDMQIILQDPLTSLNPLFTIREILTEAFKIHKIKFSKEELNNKLVNLLQEVGLSEDSINKYPHEFSGGQRQRINIARAISLEPKMIICDESVSALDVSVRSQILNLLVELRNKHRLSYIFIAHDLAVIKYIADKIIVMYLGQIVEYTSTDELYNNPKHPYTQALIRSIPNHQNIKKRTSVAIQGDIPAALSLPNSCLFYSRCPHAQAKCKVQKPILTNINAAYETKHLVACHLY